MSRRLHAGERTWSLSYASSNARKRPRKREELRALASRSIAQRMSRAQRLLSRMPAIVNTYRELVEGAMTPLTDPRAVFAAREAIRRLLVENNILLERNADHSALVGTVPFVQLGDQILELAESKRTVGHRSCRKRDQRSQSLTTDSLIAGAGVDHCGARDREGGPQ